MRLDASVAGSTDRSREPEPGCERNSSATARRETTATPTPAATARLIASVEPSDIVGRTSSPCVANRRSTSDLLADPVSRTTNGSRHSIAAVTDRLRQSVIDGSDCHEFVLHEHFGTECLALERALRQSDIDRPVEQPVRNRVAAENLSLMYVSAISIVQSQRTTSLAIERNPPWHMSLLNRASV